MSWQKLGILLELVGFFLEAVLAGILLQAALDMGKERLVSLSERWRKKRFIPDLSISFEIFALIVIIVGVLDGAVVWGWLQSNMLVFWLGIGCLVILLCMALADKGAREKNIPPGTSPWLWPLFVVLTFLSLCIGLLLFLGPLLLQIFLRLLSGVTQKLGRVKAIKTGLLLLGAILILFGLALEYMAAP